jgi:hypothetical protein
VITSDTQAPTTVRAQSPGVSQLVMKPFGEDGLLTAVRLAVTPGWDKVR